MKYTVSTAFTAENAQYKIHLGSATTNIIQGMRCVQSASAQCVTGPTVCKTANVYSCHWLPGCRGGPLPLTLLHTYSQLPGHRYGDDHTSCSHKGRLLYVVFHAVLVL